MAQIHQLHQTLLLNIISTGRPYPSKRLPHKRQSSYTQISPQFRNYHRKNAMPGQVNCCSPLKHKAYFSDGEEESHALPYVQTLREFPREELAEKFVMVRFDSAVLLREEELDRRSELALVSGAVKTIRYLCEAGARVVLVGDWSDKVNPKLVSVESVAELLSLVIQYRVVPLRISSNLPLVKTEEFDKSDIFLLENLSQFKEEAANCKKFAELLSSGVDIFVNDCFSQSHKMLASTVGIARFCYACLAGFHFEESLGQLRKAVEANKRPYVAIIGGGKLSDKTAALQFLASRCDALIFVGMMSFQIMQALGISVPSNLVENGAFDGALEIVRFARSRNIPLLFPKDFWCLNNNAPKKLNIFSALDVTDGGVPVDLGPESLNQIHSFLSNCKKILWIGPAKFRFSSPNSNGAYKLAQILCTLSQSHCQITVVGNIACKEIMEEAYSRCAIKLIESASVIWEFFKGRKLPGVLALDRAYPFEIDWRNVYCDPSQPLLVDIGSGNGFFIFEMAKRTKKFNFLGLEINEKLVRRCIATVRRYNIHNVYFIATNATCTFRSIVSSYPGELVLVSIQCPNPDFKKPNYRWRMLQRSLIEAIADLLASGGKVFLQSDIEAVSARMKAHFLKYSKDKLTVLPGTIDAEVDEISGLKDNPFGVQSDWERHVLARGAPMYRLMLSKI